METIKSRVFVIHFFSIVFVPKSDHTHCCLEDLTDMTLDFEDANSKLLIVACVADAEDRVEDSLVEVLNLKFGRDLEP